MAIMNTLTNIAKAGMMRKMLRGRFGTVLIALWAGKKVYSYYQGRKTRRARA